MKHNITLHPVAPVQSDSSAAQNCKATRKSATTPDFDSLPDSAYIRLPHIRQLLGCSNATVWRWAKAALIPAPVKLGPRVSGWNVGELRQALAQKKGA